MQISHSQIEQVLHALAEAKAGHSRGKAKLKTVRPGGESPGGLSDEKIREICRLIAAMPDTREDRLSEVMEALASGKYDPSSIEVAEKLLGRALADRLR
ncbi:MAG: hypothetical protein A2Y96_02980 [Firmicutes bacterium RBG_13_65_8]|nr:MAG: hypothetical protein A2Y96_02980 [Firmicutes bacterium RBG_13_65_8]